MHQPLPLLLLLISITLKLLKLATLALQQKIGTLLLMVQEFPASTSWGVASLSTIIYDGFLAPSQVVLSPDFWTINSRTSKRSDFFKTLQCQVIQAVTFFFQINGGHQYPSEVKHSPWKMVVGRLLSYWDGPFSGAMLNFGRVTFEFGVTFFTILKTDQKGHRIAELPCRDTGPWVVSIGSWNPTEAEFYTYLYIYS